jgi:hypothetical protein
MAFDDRQSNNAARFIGEAPDRKIPSFNSERGLLER